MQTFSLAIDDAVAVASPVLARMRLDGLDRAALPFAERHVQAWRGAPEPNMEADMLINVIKVWESHQAQSTLHAAMSRASVCSGKARRPRALSALSLFNCSSACSVSVESGEQ